MMKHMIKKLWAGVLVCAMLLGTSALAAAGAEETPVPPASENVLFSESFESDFNAYPSGWVGSSGFSARSTDYASEGTASLMLRDNSTDTSFWVRSPKLELERGIYYRISVDVYNLTGNGSVFIQFYNSDDVQTDSVSSTVTVTGKWNTVNFSVSLPESASYAVILLYSGMANRGETCYDNVLVYPEAEDEGQEIYDFDLLTDAYPRLYFTEEELSALREFAKDTETLGTGYSGKECADAVLKEADELLTQSSFSMTFYSSTTVNFTIPFTEQHFPSSPAGYSGSNFPYWQEMGNRMMEMMQTLSLAYALTGTEGYGQRAVELALSLANWSTWTEYPTVNRTSLETGYFVTGVSTVYDMCYPCLTEEQRTQLETALVKLGLEPLYADLSSFTDHNYYVNKASALAMGSLLLLGANEDAPRYLSRAYDFFAWYLDCRFESESQEGLSYTSYALDLLFGSLDQLRRVTGNSELLSHPYTDVVFRWAIMTGENAEGSGPPISDTYSDTYFFVVANVMNGTDCEGIAKWYLSTRVFSDVTDFRKMVYWPRDDVGAVETPEEYLARTGINLTNGVIGGVGWGALRTGWGEDDMLLVCVSNNSSQGHSHYDQNSFVLALGGEWILSDPGYQDYGNATGSDYTLSYGHSTIYVDGKSQSVKGGGSLSMLLDSGAYSALVGSAAGAYRDPGLSKFDRNYVMINYGGTAYYVLIDDIAAEDAHSYSWVLNAEGMQSARRWNDGGYDVFSVAGTSFAGSEFYAVGTDRALRIAFDREYTVSYDDWNGQGALISVGSGSAATTAGFCAVISALSGRGVNSITVADTVSVVGSYSNDGQTGVRTQHGDVYDIIVVSKTSGVSADGLVGNGYSASLLGLADSGLYTGYAATGTTELYWGDRLLLQAGAPVSASIFFDGSESVILGEAGTTVRIYAPNGIGTLEPDAQGYCSVTLTGARTVLSVNAGSSEAPEQSGTDTTPPADEPKGCRSMAAVPALLLVCIAGGCVLFRKKKKA